MTGDNPPEFPADFPDFPRDLRSFFVSNAEYCSSKLSVFATAFKEACLRARKSATLPPPRLLPFPWFLGVCVGEGGVSG